VTDSDQRVRIGVIGLGRMGQNHIRILSLLNGIDVRFIYDLDREAIAQVSEKTGFPGTDDLDASLRDVDAVIIASPTTTHDAYARQALEHVRNVFVEKPLTDSLESSRAVAALAQEKGAFLQVGFIERFNPAVVQMKQLLDRSERVVTVDFARTNKISGRITDVDVITDLMIHDIDLALHFNGPVDTIVAHGVAENSLIDYAAALLTHSNGRFSRIQASRITDRKMRSIEATCKDMFVDCDLLRKEITLSRQTEETQQAGEPYRITAIEEKIEVQPREALLMELTAFIGACQGKTVPGIPGVEEAVAAMDVCDKIRMGVQQSAR